MGRITRRKLLLASGAISLSACAPLAERVLGPAPTSTPAPTATPEPRPPTATPGPVRGGNTLRAIDTDIVIVGAGLAGLAAARKLKAAGKSVIILEARGRPGGRLISDPKLGPSVDVGAQWIRGAIGNPIKALVDEFGLATFRSDASKSGIFMRDGNRASSADIVVAHEAIKVIRTELARARGSASVQASVADVIDPLAARLTQNNNQRELLGYLINSEITLKLGEDSRRIALRDWGDEERFEGPDLMMTDGFTNLVNRLSNLLDIRLSQRVTSIEYDTNGATVSVDRRNFNARKVIMTTSLGVLQNARINFRPGLPQTVTDAIFGLRMGTQNKVILRFKEPFWDPELHSLGLPRGNDAALEFWNLQPMTRLPILSGQIGGSAARTLESSSQDETLRATMEALREAFGSKVPAPSEFVITRWDQDPFTYGSGSVTPAGSSGSLRDVFGKPIANALFWAGEHTSRQYPGSMHGAWLSGIRAADQILASD